jgi:hypothetical protein
MRDNWFCEYSTVYWTINSCISLFKNPFTAFKGIVSRHSILLKLLWSDIKAFLCALMFCFKGTVSQDFLLHVFFRNHLPSNLRKSPNLWTYKICYICGLSACVAICGFAICGPNNFCNSQICDLLTQIFCRLKTPANLQKNYLLFCLQIHT